MLSSFILIIMRNLLEFEVENRDIFMAIVALLDPNPGVGSTTLIHLCTLMYKAIEL